MLTAFHSPLLTGEGAGMRLLAQDIHFSMLDLDPMLFNPAYSGFFDGNGRFGVVYRNQWASVSKPFQTLSATAEFGLTRSSRTMSGLSAGLCITTDHEGSLSYGSTSATLVMSYFQSLDRNGNNILSMAVEAGGGQMGFSTEGIDMEDPSEEFNRTHVAYPALGAGVAWFWQASDMLYTKAGIAVRNLTEPDISHLGMSDTRLARRLTAYARAEWRAAAQWGVLPVVGFQHQGQFSEMVVGCDARWYLRESQRDYLAFSGGLIGRLGDALAINLAVLWREWVFAFSYDANISKLAAASHTIGAFEVGVVYLIRKKDQRTSALPCPII